jgi:hypothetical protein
MPLDKQLHFLYGAAIVLVFNAMLGMDWALFACFGAAGGKELWDRWSGRGTPDRIDAVATCLGGIICSLFICFTEIK